MLQPKIVITLSSSTFQNSDNLAPLYQLQHNRQDR